jgi:glutamyl-tRNA reductase
MEIASLVISHKKASIKEIEKAWHGDCGLIMKRILSYPNIKECALIFTCNRVEVYVVGERTEEMLRSFAEEMGVSERIIDIYKDDRCLEHILRVASGLESMIIGEDQILGQVRDFYNICKEFGGIGEVLDVVFRKAIHVGIKVRRLTNINKGSVSIGSAAVELAEKTFGLKGKKVLVIGAGEMGASVARALIGKAEIYIANRTFERGEKLARYVGGKAVRFEELERWIKECDVVISATSSPTYIITKELVERIMRERNKPLLIIDIALPRDVEESVADVDGVTLYTIDDLRAVSEENLKRRLNEAKKAEEIIKEELEHLKQLLKDLRARKAIGLMYLASEEVKNDEIRELYSKLVAKYGVDEGVIPILEDFVKSFVKKFLRKPTVRLREAARNGNFEVIEAVEYLFGGDGHGISEAKVEEVEERSLETAVQRN